MDEFGKFYNASLRFLSYRPRSEKEIRENLLRKKAPGLIIEKIISKLKEQRFLNDKEFAKWWIEQRTNVSKKSLRVIKMELLQKGINRDIIEEMMHDITVTIQSDFDRAKELVQKKIKKYEGFKRQEIYQKLGGFLGRRGFDWETIKKSIDEVLTDAV